MFSGEPIDLSDKESDSIKSHFVAFAPTEQFLIQTGKRLFKGMDDYDVWYDKDGNKLEGLPEQKYSNMMLPTPLENINSITDPNLWVDDEYCYDGTYIFITRNH